MEELRFRQVHLDFHTSGEIAGVAEDFDPDEFVAILTEARVNSVTCFAKCHHGYSYYPTTVGVRHPQLKRDLLGEQVEACHRAGIRVPAYISVVWDEQAAARHQEWLQVTREGRLAGRGPLEARGWRWLCLNTGYVDYVAAQTEEVLRRYPVDGVFFDIVMQTAPGCLCNACRARLAAAGADPADSEALRRQSLEIARAFMRRMTALVHHIRPEASVFYNSRLRLSADPRAGMRPELPDYTHLEIESLPSGPWGYNHYPLFARYFQPLGKDLLGMTARFHKSWADFGGLKNQAALEYECFAMLATGAKCSIGDQLHPRGRLERPAYERIGAVFRSVEAKEPWCHGAQAMAEIGVLLAEGQPGLPPDLLPAAAARDADEGAMRLLLESKRTFHFLDQDAVLDHYRLVLLPDWIYPGPALAAALREYLAHGGRLLLTGQSGLDPGHDHFALRELGLRSLGPARWRTPYLRVRPDTALATGVEPMDHVLYEAPWSVETAPGAEVLAHVVPPYFDRDHLHFSSHAQTPPAVSPGAPLPADAAPAITRRGSVIYIAFPLCSAYRRHGTRVYRTLLANAIDLLLPERLVWASLPSSGQVTLLQQPEENGRVIAHLLYYPAERRTPDLDVIEDVVPLHGVTLAVRPGFKPSRVYEAPAQRILPFTWQAGVATVVLERMAGHAMVVFEP
jgi:hypothetical protein